VVDGIVCSRLRCSSPSRRAANISRIGKDEENYQRRLKILETVSRSLVDVHLDFNSIREYPELNLGG